jgi:hypothetical protein
MEPNFAIIVLEKRRSRFTQMKLILPEEGPYCLKPTKFSAISWQEQVNFQ